MFVRLAAGDQPREINMPSIVTPKEFFVAERDKMYANWHVAFWRELFSNSLDAFDGKASAVAVTHGDGLNADSQPGSPAKGMSSDGSRSSGASIIIRTSFVREGVDEPVFRVHFADNGPGMSREVLEDVYMRLGMSTKADEPGSVGGFGRARILTCFSQERYRIVTGRHEVRGDGGEYEILRTTRDAKGCLLIVDIDARHARRLQSGLRHFLSQSTLSRASVKMMLASTDLNGDAMPLADLADDAGSIRWRTLFHRGRTIRDFAHDGSRWGTVSVNRSETSHRHRLIVRVNGAAMYDEHIRQPVQITLDLAPEKSRLALTAARDGLRDRFREDVMQFVQELAVDEKSALKDRRKQKRWVFFAGAKGTSVISRAGNASSEAGVGKDAADEARADRSAGADSRKPGEINQVIEGNIAIAGFPGASSAGAAGPETARQEDAGGHTGASGSLSPPRQRVIGYSHNVVVLFDDPTAAQQASATQFLPRTWIKADMEGRGSGMAARLLFAAWTQACRQSIEVLLRNEPDLGNRIDFLTGFVFSSHLGAAHSRISGRELLLLNPVDADGRVAWHLSNPDDRRRLRAVAMHEVSHIAESWHCERYAKILTDLVGQVNDAETDRIMREAMKGMRASVQASRGRPWATDSALYSREGHGEAPDFF